jgi:archaellum biogenesis ATPase FlaH
MPATIPPVEVSTAQPQAPLPFGIMPLAEFIAKMQRDDSAPYLIEGLIPVSSVNILVGDSGLGKSPLAYQMAYAVCSGTPFLGLKTEPGTVLHFDLENSGEDIAALADSLRRHFGLAAIPHNLLIQREANASVTELEETLLGMPYPPPKLAIIDSLRAYNPGAEKNNTDAASFLNDLKSVARNCSTAFLVIHHIRKGSEGYPQSPLEDTPTLTWLRQASGARGLVNQTDVRMAVDSSNKAAMILKFYARVKGESGPMYVDREFDSNGEPVGYRLMTGVELLGNPDHIAAYAALPAEFTTAEAARILGRAADPTNKFLIKCIGLGIVKKMARGRYRKIQGERSRTV